MRDLGYRVIRFGHRDDWPQLIDTFTSVFGEGHRMSFAAGSLVHARGREWVVLPESDDDLVMVRPLGGTDDEITGILTDARSGARRRRSRCPTQPISATTARPACCATPCGSGSVPAPGRSARSAKIAVEPRPYQLVPLLMALKLDPVRLLIADDVGIGKTVEAGLVAKELLEQGDARKLAVLCPPHLAEQWQAELATSSTSTPSSSSRPPPPASSAASPSASRSSTSTTTSSSRSTSSSPTAAATTSSAPAPSW